MIHKHTEQILRALRSSLALLYALIIAAVLILILPVFGIAQDFIVTSVPAQTNGISHAVANSEVISKNIARDISTMTTRVRRIGDSDALQLTVYGDDRSVLVRQHDLVSDIVLEAIETYYPQERGFSFTFIGQKYNKPNVLLVTAIIIFAVLAGTYLSHLSMMLVRDILVRRSHAAKKSHAIAAQEAITPVTDEVLMQHTLTPTQPRTEHALQELSPKEEARTTTAAEEIVSTEDARAQLDTLITQEAIPTYDLSETLPAIPEIPEEEFIAEAPQEFTPVQKTSVQPPAQTAKKDVSQSSTATRTAPGNLPVVEAPLTVDDVENGAEIPQAESVQDNTTPEKFTKEAPEASDDELKRRLNQLLKGEI